MVLAKIGKAIRRNHYILGSYFDWTIDNNPRWFGSDQERISDSNLQLIDRGDTGCGLGWKAWINRESLDVLLTTYRIEWIEENGE